MPPERNPTEPHWLVTSSHEVLSLWGLEPIEQGTLGKDDLDVRVWSTGFATQGFILRRRQGMWEFFHISNQDSINRTFRGYAGAQIYPNCDVDWLLEQLEQERVFELRPVVRNNRTCDAVTNECMDFVTVDGMTLMVESRRANTINRVWYDNPPDHPGQLVSGDPEDEQRAYRILRLVDQALAGPEIAMLPHSRPVTPPQIVLLRYLEEYVYAIKVVSAVYQGIGGELEIESRLFELTGGLNGIQYEDVELDDPETRKITWTGVLRDLGLDAPLVLDYDQDGRLRVSLEPRSPHSGFDWELAVTDASEFTDLTFEDFTNGYEAVPHEYTPDICRRVSRLTPAAQSED